MGRLCRTGTRCSAAAAQRAESVGPAFAGAVPGVQQLPRSVRSRLGRLLPDRAPVISKAAAEERAESGGPALPDRAPVISKAAAEERAESVGPAFAGAVPGVQQLPRSVRSRLGRLLPERYPVFSGCRAASGVGWAGFCRSGTGCSAAAA